jgi:hypothetical protein
MTTILLICNTLLPQADGNDRVIFQSIDIAKFIISKMAVIPALVKA